MNSMIFSTKDIAKICYEANRTLCATQSDNVQANWGNARELEKNRYMDGVIYKINNPLSTIVDWHDAWMKQQIEGGWVYGERASKVEKTDPYLKPFDKLPLVQKAKDHLFCAIVDSLLPFAEKQD